MNLTLTFNRSKLQISVGTSPAQRTPPGPAVNLLRAEFWGVGRRPFDSSHLSKRRGNDLREPATRRLWIPKAKGLSGTKTRRFSDFSQRSKRKPKGFHGCRKSKTMLIGSRFFLTHREQIKTLRTGNDQFSN